APRAAVAVFALAADTEEEAKRLARSRDLWIVRLYTGRPGAFPSVEEAESYPYTLQEAAIVEHGRRRTIAGDPEQGRSGLPPLAREPGAEEIRVVTIAPDSRARRPSPQPPAGVLGPPGPRAKPPASP